MDVAAGGGHYLRRWRWRPADSHSCNDLQRAVDSAIDAGEKCDEIGMPGANRDQRGLCCDGGAFHGVIRVEAPIKPAMTYDTVSGGEEWKARDSIYAKRVPREPVE